MVDQRFLIRKKWLRLAGKCTVVLFKLLKGVAVVRMSARKGTFNCYEGVVADQGVDKP
jgi:hypothetical protein